MTPAVLWISVILPSTRIRLPMFSSAIAAFAVTRPLVKKYINSRTQPTNADMLIGQECLVTEDIDNLAGRGAVSVGGKVWTARRPMPPSPPGLRPSCCALRASSSSSHPPA